MIFIITIRAALNTIICIIIINFIIIKVININIICGNIQYFLLLLLQLLL